MIALRYLAGVALLTPPLLSAEIDFSRDIRPIFNAHCVACHGGVKEAGDVSFIYREKALGHGDSGKPVIVPGDPEASEMMVRILSKDADEVMPKPAHGPPLAEREVALLKQWIKEGASWKEHWAFVPPEVYPAPEVKDAQWAKRDLDGFILARLEREELRPAAEASRAALLRRVSLDLTGLPPTLGELDAFLSNTSATAYEDEVDRLLSSPNFGERWASVWMDLARYADSEGLGQDHRRDVWKYRDWLISSLNQDMPFDEFTIEQLAGDLLPKPTLDQRIATTFHRLSQTNNEGGTDDEEFRVTAVMDRVATTWEVWQGLTMGCVQCHSHPYDPIEHEDYFKFMSFFNNSADADIGEGLPLLSVPLDASRHAEAGQLQELIGDLETEFFKRQRAIAADTRWQPAVGMKLQASKGKLEVQSHDGVEEFRTVGNVATKTVFQIDVPAPKGLRSITAMRLDVLPLDETKAKHTPEWGTLLRHIRLEVRSPDGSLKEVRLAEVLTDEAHPFFDPNESLKGTKRGWGPYSKMSQARHAIVLLASRLELSAGDELRVMLEHTELAVNGSFVMITRRGRLAFTDEARWSEFVADADIQRIKNDRVVAKRKLKAIPSTTTPDIRELPTELQRATHLFVRGNWLDKGEPIERAGVPHLFGDLADTRDRLAMARWMASPANPLTARVAVNRFWLELFGTGIVPTPEDFGSAGEKPTHPELLDTLAARFQSEMKWSIKTLLRELVTSSTYRQDGKVSAELAERDADNRLLARGPRQRLTGEMVRDHGLVVSGLLANRQGGKPAHPPLPPKVWTPFDADDWDTPAKGMAERYRRSVYTYWKRSIPYPVFSTFDAPTRELCSKRRVVSNTPLQALSVLNDPAFQEFAEGLAKRMQREFAGGVDERLADGYRAVTSQRISTDRLNELKGLFNQLEAQYRLQPKLAKELAADPEAAAYAVVATVLLNLDEALIR